MTESVRVSGEAKSCPYSEATCYKASCQGCDLNKQEQIREGVKKALLAVPLPMVYGEVVDLEMTPEIHTMLRCEGLVRVEP